MRERFVSTIDIRGQSEDSSIDKRGGAEDRCALLG